MHFEKKNEQAFKWAAEKHAGDTYSYGTPYTQHLLHVQQVLHRFGWSPYIDATPEHISLSEDLSIAAILHDIVEDTDVTLKDVRKRFGKRVSSLVNGVTNEPGKNRAERHRKTHSKTKRIPGALTLKLADRIANIESCIASGDGRIGMYKKEWKSFQKKLRTEGELDRMWNYLGNLLKSSSEVDRYIVFAGEWEVTKNGSESIENSYTDLDSSILEAKEVLSGRDWSEVYDVKTGKSLFFTEEDLD